MSGPCVEFGWYVDVAVNVVQVVVPDYAMHLGWIHFAGAPLKIKESSIVDGEISECDVLLPLGWTTDLLVECVVCTSAVDGIAQSLIDWFKNWRVHPIGTVELEHGLERSGGLFGSGRNVDAVPTVMVVVAQDNFLLSYV